MSTISLVRQSREIYWRSLPVNVFLPQFELRISVPQDGLVPLYPSSATLKKLALAPLAVVASATLAMYTMTGP